MIIVLVHNCRYLATGDSYFTIGTSYRISRSAISIIIPETCQALWDVLCPEVMPIPNLEKWRQIAMDFESFWQFPNCHGAIDGKHINIEAPANTGSLYFNYKKNFSVVLMAVVDASYKFVLVDIGAYGRQGDANVFARSTFGKRLLAGDMQLSPSKRLPGEGSPTVPPVFVGDEAFPLRTNLMRPYPGTGLTLGKKIFNYRLSRARRVVENAFGILATRFRVFRRPINLKPSNIDAVIKGAVVLHNYLRQKAVVQYIGANSVGCEDGEGDVRPGEWRDNYPKCHH